LLRLLLLRSVATTARFRGGLGCCGAEPRGARFALGDLVVDA
jgi:hypothetical protein